MGLNPPSCAPLSEDEKASARGGCQILVGALARIFHSVQENSPSMDQERKAMVRGGPSGLLRDSDSTRWPHGRGFPPELAPMAYDPFIAMCITHPQMVELHKMMLGPEVRYDHNTLLSRRSFGGQHWHSHDYTENDMGVTTRPGGAKLRLVRSLVYPDGFGKHDDGGLKVVPGAHLYRSQSLLDCDIPYDRGAPPGADDDALFEQTWLAGKLHPITGEPLRIVHLELPPGSMAVCLAHTPHGVSPRPEGSGTRHCTLFSYRQPDPECAAPVTTNANLQPWELERDCALGKLPGLRGGPANLFSLY